MKKFNITLEEACIGAYRSKQRTRKKRGSLPKMVTVIT